MCVILRLIRNVVELYIQLTLVAKHSFIRPESAGSGVFLGGAACRALTHAVDRSPFA